MSGTLEAWAQPELKTMERSQNLRALRILEPRSATEALVQVEGAQRAVTLFSTNDYLGLSHHPKVRSRISHASEQWGAGPRGSPLICGYTSAHEALERELAALFKKPCALLFPTGYSANLALISAIADSDTTVFSDALNHASIIDGCRLSQRTRGAKLEVYRHADPEDLESRLKRCDSSRKLIISETVFSMDGDRAPLSALVDLKHRYSAALVLDESHAALVFDHGGLVTLERRSDGVDAVIGTLSKAVGAQGGFCASGPHLRSWLLNRGRAYVFSTAAPVPVVYGARAALEVSRDEPGLRDSLNAHMKTMAQRLGKPVSSPIIPIILKDPSSVLALQTRLLQQGLHVAAVRPPTVPEGTSRLRISLSAAHTKKNIDALLEALREYF